MNGVGIASAHGECKGKIVLFAVSPTLRLTPVEEPPMPITVVVAEPIEGRLRRDPAIVSAINGAMSLEDAHRRRAKVTE